MPPLIVSQEIDYISDKSGDTVQLMAENKHKVKIVWRNVLLISGLHISAIYGAFLMITEAKYQTIFAWYLFSLFSGMGITAGAHRLWAHRSYKAKVQLRILLCFLNTMAVQNDLYDWTRDHRVHHKFSETDADPHNATRGFFFSHIGWLLCRKHPDVLEKGKTVDLSDVWSDPVVRFQRKYYHFLVAFVAIYLPASVPYFCWSESLWNSFFICVIFRYCYILNSTWLVNSAAHMWGQKPYDININPRENSFVTYQSYGEGYHNYHHTFPFDYSASELDWKYNWNFSTMFIDFFAYIGWAYDRKKVSVDTIKARIERTSGHTFNANRVELTKYQLWFNRIISVTIALSHLWIPFIIRMLVL